MSAIGTKARHLTLKGFVTEAEFDRAVDPAKIVCPYVAAFAHNRLEDGGREVTMREMPAMEEMAIVNMPAGKARLTVVDAGRYVSVDDLDVGDM